MSSVNRNTPTAATQMQPSASDIDQGAFRRLSVLKIASAQHIEQQYENGYLVLLRSKMLMHQKLSSDLAQCMQTQSPEQFNTTISNYNKLTAKLEENFKNALQTLQQEKQRLENTFNQHFFKLCCEQLLRSSQHQHQPQPQPEQTSTSTSSSSSETTATSAPSISEPSSDVTSLLQIVQNGSHAPTAPCTFEVSEMPQFNASLMPSLEFVSADRKLKLKQYSQHSHSHQSHAQQQPSVVCDHKFKLFNLNDVGAPAATASSPPLLRVVEGANPVIKIKKEKLVKSRVEVKKERSESCLSSEAESSNSQSEQSTESGSGSNEAKYLKCLACNTLYSDEEVFLTHTKECHATYRRSNLGSLRKKYACSECNRSFAQVNALIIHVRCHTGAKPFQCRYCSKRFRQSCHLIRHQRLHTGEKPYACEWCDKKFSSSTRKNRHCRNEHGSQMTHATKKKLQLHKMINQ